MPLPHSQLSNDVGRALRRKSPVVALESTVITHGLPRPQNIQLARDMERAVEGEGGTPATVALLDGRIHIGLTDEELERLAQCKSPLKVSLRDFASAILKKADGGTTVAGTMFAAHRVGIQVFATGGIGGVHKESSFDISADLHALAETPMIVVCAGAKAILDLPATLEYLETMGVPVVGYQTDAFPEFYSLDGRHKVSIRLETPERVVEFAQAHWSLGMRSAVLVANPIPASDAIPRPEMEPILAKASGEARKKNIQGQALTPFLLQRISELSHERSIRANLALLLNNARLAAQIANAFSATSKRRKT